MRVTGYCIRAGYRIVARRRPGIDWGGLRSSGRHGWVGRSGVECDGVPTDSDMSTCRPRHRRCLVVHGDAADTEAQALALLAAIADDAVFWIGTRPAGRSFEVLPPRQVSSMLGRAFDAVVLDAHAGLDPDALGQAHGLVWGGGGLILRLPAAGISPSTDGQRSLAAHPHGVEDVGRRFATHWMRALDRAQWPPPSPLSPAPREVTGTTAQAAVVERLVAAWSEPAPTRIALLADRGRGKSSALGLALCQLLARTDRRVAITGPRPEAVVEVLRFAAGSRDSCPAQFVPLADLVFEPEPYDVIVVDEAAQLPVPMLQRLVEAHRTAHLAWATTTHGYEGTGRGFSLRFLAGLSRGPIAVQRLHLHPPIRWDADDPLERFVFDALLLDEGPPRLDATGRDHGAEPPSSPAVPIDSRVEAVALDRDALVDDEPTLRALFGLLVHAHYRTTPGDLRRILDAPNLHLHALRLDGEIVAATVVAVEGGLPPDLCDAMAVGRTRIRAHALPDALIAHLGHRDAGGLTMLRSVRIAVDPRWRRRGLATRLVEHVHRMHTPDLQGTLFGATTELLAFRRTLGYQLVRISASRGARTGEPSAMMLRPVSDAAHALVTQLRAEFARDLDPQLALMQADGETLLEPALVEALHHRLPPPASLPRETAEALTRGYAHGPRTFESVALAVRHFLDAHPERLDRLEPAARQVVRGRVIDGRGWRHVTAAAGMPSVAAAMRALRRAVRVIVEPD